MNAQQDIETENGQEVDRLRQENIKLLDELEMVYQQFLNLKGETDISYTQLRARNQDLEQKVDELERINAELEEAENQLIHSERLAAMGQLAASIVHELSSPLTVITGYIELLIMRSSLNEQEMRLLKIAQQHAESMTHLVREILSFSHKQVVPFGIFDVNELVDYVVTFFGNLVKNHTFTIEKNLKPDLPHLIGSAQQIQQVFINMITNASDAMRGRGTQIIETEVLESSAVVGQSSGADVASARSQADVQTLCEKYPWFIAVRFKDNGPGIPPDILSSIFNPFFTTKPAGKGTGLGLSICRTIMERHDGNILVSSLVDHGATFTVLLPVRNVKDLRGSL